MGHRGEADAGGDAFERDEVVRVFTDEWADEVSASGRVSLYGRGADRLWTNVYDEADEHRTYEVLAVAAELRSDRGKPPNDKSLLTFAESVREDGVDLGGMTSIRESARRRCAGGGAWGSTPADRGGRCLGVARSARGHRLRRTRGLGHAALLGPSLG